MEVGDLQVIVSLLALVVTYLIVRPLQVAIDGLQKTIEALKTEIHENRIDLNGLREKIGKSESSISSAHKRLDEHSTRLHALETHGDNHA